MPRKLTRREKIATRQQDAQEPSTAAPSENPRRGPRRRRLTLVLGLVVAALGWLLYLNTLGNQYTVDDFGVITGNLITRQGLRAVPVVFKTAYWAGLPGVSATLYRPLSKAVLAIEWALAPNRPALGHVVNVFLYGLTGFLLFVMLCQYLKGQLLLPFVTAVLFMAHPIHTEVVANIKGLDESLCFLFFVLTAMAVHRYATRGSWLYLSLGCAALFLSLLSKESAVTFLAVIPLMLFFFTESPRSRTAIAFGVLALVTAVFEFIRYRVLANALVTFIPLIDNYLAAVTDAVVRKATAVYLLGVYVQRLVVPHPLISDGSFRNFPVVSITDWRFLLAFVVCTALVLYAVLRLRRKDPLSFGILYFFITVSVASNIFVLIGTNYGERLMYTPSLGVCLALGALLVRGFRADESGTLPPTVQAFFRAHRGPLIALALLTALFGVKTVTRNADWYDNRTLYSRDVRLAPGSARLHSALGHDFLEEAERLGGPPESPARREIVNRAVGELEKAVAIHPRYPQALGGLALAYQALNQGDKAQQYYERALQTEPTGSVNHNNYGNLLFLLGDLDRALREYQLAVRISPEYATAHANLGLVYGRLVDRSVTAAREEEKRKNEKRYQELMAAARDSFQAAVFHLDRAIAMDPYDDYAYQVLGGLYEYAGDETNAKYYQGLAAQLKRRQSR